MFFLVGLAILVGCSKPTANTVPPPVQSSGQASSPTAVAPVQVGSQNQGQGGAAVTQPEVKPGEAPQKGTDAALRHSIDG